jgi:PAS domain S-box-containing protein
MPHQPPAGLPTPRLISSDCRILLDAAPDAMLVVNREGEVVVANPAAERLFGFFGDEFTGRIVESLLPERFRKQHKLDRAIFVSDPRARPMGADLELFALRSDGCEVPVDIGLSPLTVDGETYTLVAIRDVTEGRKLSASRNASTAPCFKTPMTAS